MKGKFAHIVREKPLFLLLLPVFFVWHNYVDFYDLISPSKAILLVFYYFIGTILVYLLARFILKNNRKAALFGFLVMCLYFFFGSLQDLLQKKFPGAFINKYSVLLPALLLVFVFAFIMIKRSKSPLTKMFSYLNALVL